MPTAALPAALTARPTHLPSPQTTRAFFAWLLSALPRALAIEVLAWIVCFAVLTATLRTVRKSMKPSLMRLDDNVRAWAKTLRYRAQHPEATPETARRAALVELQAQRAAYALDPELPPVDSSDDEPDLQQSAHDLVRSIARDKAAQNTQAVDSVVDTPQEEIVDTNDDGVISQAERIAAALDDEGPERVPRTWFFRFWTNFASAPSLSTMSLAIPLYASHRAGGVSASADLLARAFPNSYWARVLAQNIAPPQLAAVAAAGLSASALRAARIWTLPGLCYLGSMVLSFWLKRVFKRLRPQRKPGDFGHKLKDGSFPSGHSLTSFCFWAAITMSAFFAGASALQTAALGATSATIVALTGLSRVYMGVHFPTDVLGGFFIGLVWCAVSLPSLRWALHLKAS
jgi:membrane-associated phospholipid phosphatase